jgi:hypothetical protein
MKVTRGVSLGLAFFEGLSFPEMAQCTGSYSAWLGVTSDGHLLSCAAPGTHSLEISGDQVQAYPDSGRVHAPQVRSIRCDAGTCER